MKWNELIKVQCPESGAFLQTPEWGKFQSSIGRKVFYIASIGGEIKLLNETQVQQTENLVGLALAILMPISYGKKFLYIPRGPIGQNTEQIINTVKQIAQKEKAIFIKIELPKAETWKLKPGSSFTLQPEKTVILDLTKSAPELLAAMHTKTRYNIALARRHGITIKRLDYSALPQNEATGLPHSPELARNDMFDQWFELMSATARRDGFFAHPKEYYKKLLEINENLETLAPGQAQDDNKAVNFKTALWLAFDGDDLLAGNLIGYFNHTVTYLHGASSNIKRNLMAPFLLHWEIILDAQTNGFKAYDFWGINSKKWPGITRFKQNFGNATTLHEIVYPKAIDIPLNHFWHFLYNLKKRKT